jgi:hypothetical protein
MGSLGELTLSNGVHTARTGNLCDFGLEVEIMDAFLLVDKNKTEWRFVDSALIAELPRYWTSATLTRVTDPRRKSAAYDWSIPIPGSPAKSLNGYFSSSGTRIGLKGQIEDCVNFVLWVRAIVPDTIELEFGDDQHPKTFTITKTTNGAEVRLAFK